MKVKHVIFKNNVLQVTEVAGIGSSLKALKNKGEGDGSETFFRTLVMQTRYKEVTDYFSCFWRTKSSSVGRIDPSGSKDTHRGQKGLMEAQKSK